MATRDDGKLTEEMVLKALSAVKDPELGRDLVTLGMIKDLVVEDGCVSLKVNLTTPACPLKSQIRREVEAAVKALPGVREVAVEMGAQVLGARYRQKEPIPGVRNVIAVASGKGGVGKSTVAVNLAVALADSGAKVGVLDADITGPSIPIMMGVSERPMATPEKKIKALENYGVKLMSIGFFVEGDTAVVWRGPMVSGALQQFLHDVDWGQLDYLVVDLPPGTSDASLTLAQSIPLTGVVIVSTPQDVALQDVVKAISMFRQLDVPILGIVENMSYFICPHCRERTDIFSHGGAQRTSEHYGVPFLGEIPLDPDTRVCGDEGVPVVRAYPSSVQSEVFRKVAGVLAGRVSVENFGRGGAVATR